MIYELKTYEAAEGSFETMRDRFLAEAAPRLARHGVEVVAVYQEIAEFPKLVYLTRGASAEALAAGWAAFGADPEWQAIKKTSELNGPLLSAQSSTKLRQLDLPAEIATPTRKAG